MVLLPEELIEINGGIKEFLDQIIQANFKATQILIGSG